MNTSFIPREEIGPIRTSFLDTPISPFFSYKEGKYATFDKKTSLARTDERMSQKLIERSKLSTFIDISDPNLWLYSVPYFEVNLLPLYIANPFPNGMFIHLQDWDKNRSVNEKIHNSICMEIYKVRDDDIRLTIYRFEGRHIIHPTELTGFLFLEAAFYVKPDGKIKEHYIQDFGKNEILFKTRKVYELLFGKFQALLKFLLTCNKLKTHITVNDIPIEKEELQNREISYKGDISKVLYIKETPRILEAISSISKTGNLPKRYHSVRGHMATSKLGKKFFRKAHHRGNKEIGEVHKIYKMESDGKAQ